MWVLNKETGKHVPPDLKCVHYMVAVSYFSASVALHNRKVDKAYVEQPFDRLPVHNNLNHSIELILKSYLLEKGVEEKEVVAIGHDLQELVAKCEALNADVSPEFKEAALGEGRMHKGHYMRYYGPRTDQYRSVDAYIYFSNLENLIPIVEKELERLAPKVCPWM